MCSVSCLFYDYISTNYVSWTAANYAGFPPSCCNQGWMNSNNTLRVNQIEQSTYHLLLSNWPYNFFQKKLSLEKKYIFFSRKLEAKWTSVINRIYPIAKTFCSIKIKNSFFSIYLKLQINLTRYWSTINFIVLYSWSGKYLM